MITEKLTNINEDNIATLVDDGRFIRGQALFKRGCVEEIDIEKHRLKVVVNGTENYKVLLFFSKNLLQGECECTDSQQLDFCKHCVTTVLYAIQHIAAKMLTKK